MSQSSLPYALATPTFPFRHLAALAGRAPIGGAREVALGCFVAARLAADRGRADTEPTLDGREARAAAARSWLGTLTLPATVRTPLARCIETTAAEGTLQLSRTVTALRDACADYLDAGSRAELDALAQALDDAITPALPPRAAET